MIIIFTGDGKGKTSAALGTALRASGWQKRVAILQFIKGNKQTGEWQAIKKLGNIDIFQFLNDHNLYIAEPEQKHRESMNEAIAHLKSILQEEKYDLVILDEINNAIHHQLLDPDQIVTLLKSYPKIDFILTGRNLDRKLLALADTVTEMRKIKHPFDSKTMAKKGIDY